MQIKKNFDVVGGKLPSYQQGTSPENNPQIAPHESAIPETPGENATNDTSQFEMSKAQPFSKKGAGYTG